MQHIPLDRSRRLDQRPRASARLGLAAVLVALGVASGVSGCSVVTPYKIDIQQGNVVTREQASALQPGMSRVQVRDVLGSPLLTSVFHAQRWDYVFTFRRQGQPEQKRQLTVYFKGDVLERFEADELPSEVEFVASLDKRRTLDKAPVLQATDEQLKAFQERNASASTPGPIEPPAVTRTYPPLEEAPGASR